MKANNSKFQIVAIGVGLLFLTSGMPAQASLKQIKLYKEAFGDAKPKCIECHKDEKPKKEDGLHELNEYGQAVLDADKEITAESYKKVGKIEDFKKK